MTVGHDEPLARQEIPHTEPERARSVSQIEGDDMITADPTFFWIFLIGFGVIALRMLQRTHGTPVEPSAQPVRSRDDPS